MSERKPQPLQDEEAWAMRVETTALTFEYPPTPNLTPAVRAALRRPPTPVVVQRLAQASLILLLIVLGLMVVPSIRAAVIESLRLGSIQIFVGSPTETTTPMIITQTPGRTPAVEPTPLPSALDLPNEITLADARTLYPKMVILPTFPPDLGLPNHVFDTPMLTFVWTDPNDPMRVRLVLGMLRSASVGTKFFPWEPETTKVNGNLAYWSTEPHTLMIFPQEVGDNVIQRQVAMHTLLWYDNSLTLRIETNDAKDEAIRMAESLR